MNPAAVLSAQALCALLALTGAAGALHASEATTDAEARSGQTLAADGRPRFLLDGEIALDRSTGLAWRRCSVGQRWDGARGCVGLASKLWFEEARALQSSRWRLPTVAELQSLYERSESAMADPVAFPDAPATWFWAAGVRGEAAAWGPRCGDGGNESCYQGNARAVRLVRRADGRK